LAKMSAAKVLKAAGVFPKTEYDTVTNKFNKSPLSLKKSKPNKAQRRQQPGALAAWNKRRIESKMAHISGTPFPCQRGAMFPDTRASERRFKTFLYYYSSARHNAKLAKSTS
jgi:hypothetical protein